MSHQKEVLTGMQGCKIKAVLLFRGSKKTLLARMLNRSKTSGRVGRLSFRTHPSLFHHVSGAGDLSAF